MIKIKNLYKYYGNSSAVALDNINLNINKGDIFGVIGYSGAGKSSLLKVINSLEEPSKGSVIIDGFDINSHEFKSKKTLIATIFQHFNLLDSKNVSENILLPLKLLKVPKNEQKQKLQEIINLVGLNGKEKAYPSHLSGGEKQRVGIARALIISPKILLCDEPTSALDPINKQSILNLIKEINLKTGLTIFIITHQMEVIKNICNRCAILSKGQIVEEGDINSIIYNPKTQLAKTLLGEQGLKLNNSEHILSIILDKNNLLNIFEELINKFNSNVSLIDSSLFKNDNNLNAIITFKIQIDKDYSFEEVIEFLKQKNIKIKG